MGLQYPKEGFSLMRSARLLGEFYYGIAGDQQLDGI
jgi:hypothetical protein